MQEKITITKEKINKYYNLSKRALEMIKKSIIKGKENESKDVLEMAECYLKDSKHFEAKNDRVNAFACINYAHGWIDCACRLKVFKVNDPELFAVDENKEN